MAPLTYSTVMLMELDVLHIELVPIKIMAVINTTVAS